MNPIEPPQPPSKPFPWAVLAIPMGALAVLVALFVGIWQFLAPAPDQPTMTAYSDFVSEVRAGRVDEIQIRDHEYRYRLRLDPADTHRRASYRAALGPTPDQALLDSLKPTDPTVPPPKIVFTK